MSTDHYLKQPIMDSLSARMPFLYDIVVSPHQDGTQTVIVTNDKQPDRQVNVILHRMYALSDNKQIGFSNTCITVCLERDGKTTEQTEPYSTEEYNAVAVNVIPLSNVYEVIPEVQERWVSYCMNIFNLQCVTNIRTFLGSEVSND